MYGMKYGYLGNPEGSIASDLEKYGSDYGMKYGTLGSPSESVKDAPIQNPDSKMSGSDKLGYAQIGGNFVSNYLAQRAAEFENKRKLALQAAQGYQSAQENAYDTMLKVYANSLLGIK